MTDVDRRTLLKFIGAGTGTVALGAPLLSRASAARGVISSSSAAGKTLSEKIADYIVGARFEDLPPAVIQKAKEQIVFFFGRAFEISFMEQGRQMRQAARQTARTSDGATVIGEQLRLAPSDAAFANATLFGGSLSMDDVLAHADIHAGVITLPAALAIGEVRRVSGRELILALVLGYEVLGKLGRAALGWTAPFPRCSTDIFGGFGPITVAGRLLQLDRERMANALGYAANLCTGIGDRYSLISRNGTFVAQLAEAGAGPYSRTTIEDELGPYRSFFGEVPAELPKSIDNLGYWEILTAVQKHYRGTGHNTTAIELFADLVEKNQLTVDEVSHVDAVLPAKDSRARELELSCRGPFKPAGRAAASLPYSLALVLLDGKIDAGRFADDGIVNDRTLRSVMQKIDVAFDGGHGTRWTKLTVHTTDGRKFERESDFFTFELPPDRWDDWLRASGQRLLSPEQLGQLEQLISNLEHVDDVSKLLAAATPVATVARS